MGDKKYILCLCAEENANLLEPAIILEGYDVINLKDGNKIEEYLKKGDIKCVFIDPFMQEVNLSDLMEVKKNYSIPFIALIKKKNDKLLNELLENGFDKVLELEKNSFGVQEKIERIFTEIS